jgi:hypothetical protein
VSFMKIRIPEAMPQADYELAPLALNTAIKPTHYPLVLQIPFQSQRCKLRSSL